LPDLETSSKASGHISSLQIMHLRRPAARPVPGILAGLGYPLRGARFVYVEHRGLAKFWLPPIALSCFAFGAVIWLALAVHGRFAEELWATPVGEGWSEVAMQVLHRILSWLIALALISAGMLVVALGTSVIAAPFNDALSEAVEVIAAGRTPAPFNLPRMLRSLGRTLGLELGKWLLYAAVMGPLWIVNWLLPGPGSVLYLVAGTSITALFFAIDYLDFSAARHDWSLRQRAGLAVTRLPSVMGLGFGIWVLLFIPVINLLFMPAAVAGATLLFLDLQPDSEKAR
jgi:CysZ protein